MKDNPETTLRQEQFVIILELLHVILVLFISESFCLLQLETFEYKHTKNLVVPNILTSKIIDVRKQARPSNASYRQSKMTSMHREFGHIIYCVRIDEESCLFRVFFQLQYMYQTETGSILCAQVIVVSSDPISPFFIQEGRTKLENTLQCI